MSETGRKSRKIYYSMGEVSEMFDVNPSLIRFWEQKFSILKPNKNKKGNRMFTRQDVENLKLIYHLVKENGMTLAGAQKRLKENREGIEHNLEIIERLQGIKALLLEVRQELKRSSDETVEIIVDEAFSPFSEGTSSGEEEPVPVKKEGEKSSPTEFGQMEPKEIQSMDTQSVKVFPGKEVETTEKNRTEGPESGIDLTALKDEGPAIPVSRPVEQPLFPEYAAPVDPLRDDLFSDPVPEIAESPAEEQKPVGKSMQIIEQTLF